MLSNLKIIGLKIPRSAKIGRDRIAIMTIKLYIAFIPVPLVIIIIIIIVDIYLAPIQACFRHFTTILMINLKIMVKNYDTT